MNRPIVGVVVGIKPIPLQEMKNYPRLMKLAEANLEAKTNLNFFSSRDVELSKSRVRGTYYNFSTKRWERKQFSLPDVIYVRGGSGKEIDDLLSEFDLRGSKELTLFMLLIKAIFMRC
jgi:hypothetical protein